VPDSVESAQRALDTCQQQRDSALEACNQTISQGQALLQELHSVGLHNAVMDSTGSVAAVEAALDRITKQRDEIDDLWANRKLKLDLCLRLRHFERDALEVRLCRFSRQFIFCGSGGDEKGGQLKFLGAGLF